MAMPQRDTDDGIITVRNADHMDVDTFRKHMAMRHRTSLMGRTSIGPFHELYVELCWRTFHATIHRLSLYGDMDHDHGA